MSETTKVDSRTVIVHAEAGDVIVRKLALGDYAAVLRALDTLPGALGEIFKKDKADITNEYLLSLLPTIIADHLQEFAGILAAATDRDSEFFVKELDLAETLEVFDAAFELNDYSQIANIVKKLMAGRRTKVTASK